LSCMDPETGESSVTVTLPLKGLSSGTYPLILNNKIGIGTTPFVDDNDKGHLPEINVK